MSLTSAEVDNLLGLDARLTVLGTGRPGVYDLQASERVGAVVAGDLTVIIEPKIPVANLLFLIGQLEDFSFDALAPMAADASLVEAMAGLYAGVLESALRAGLVQEYRDHEEDLRAARGRIDWMEVQTRRFGLVPPIACHYSDLTADTELNRRLLAAATLLARILGVTGVAPQARARLGALTGRFVGVGSVQFGRGALRPLSVDRRTARFRTPLVIAEAILREASLSLRPGQALAPSFLVDMNKVFEAFVLRSLAACSREFGVFFEPHPRSVFLDDDERLILDPDGVVRHHDGSAAAVVDAKYKDRDSADRHDVYQMHAYCSGFGVARGVLVYASKIAETSYTFDAGGSRIDVVQVDLTSSPAHLRRRFREILGSLLPD